MEENKFNGQFCEIYSDFEAAAAPLLNLLYPHSKISLSPLSRPSFLGHCMKIPPRSDRIRTFRDVEFETQFESRQYHSERQFDIGSEEAGNEREGERERERERESVGVLRRRRLRPRRLRSARNGEIRRQF